MKPTAERPSAKSFCNLRTPWLERGSTGCRNRSPTAGATSARSSEVSACIAPIDHPPAVFPESFQAPRMVV